MRNWTIILAFIFFGGISCDKNEDFDKEEEVVVQNLRGTGNFVYTGYAPLSDKPLTVYYHIPETVNDFAPILLVFHGGSRDAKESRDKLISKANLNRLIVIVPEFSEANFPGSDRYNLGNVFVDGDRPSAQTLNNQDIWTFSYVEPLFDHIKLIAGNNNATYHTFGFSAGAQFLHRFLIFKPDARVNKSVAAASGWYTMPDLQIDFPYGTNEAPLNQASLDAFFLKELTVLVGENDNDPNAASLRRNSSADVQGTNRFDRANYFVNQSSTIANSTSSSFNWQLRTLPNTGHDFLPLAAYAIDNVILN